MLKRWFGAFFAGLLVILSSVPAGAADHVCRPRVDERIAGLGIPAEDVIDVRFEPIVLQRTRGSVRVIGAEAWIALKSCPNGGLVMTMTLACTPTGEFTTGRCRVPGVRC